MSHSGLAEHRKVAAYVDESARRDHASRRKKADKIRAILDPHVDLHECDVLDIGTSAGYIQHYLSPHTKSLTSVDIIDERLEKRGYKFKKIPEGATLPFADNSFDAVISSHVIEHVPDQQTHMDEIHRVLKPGGVAYLATPSKFTPLEPHYKLPFLSWIPHGLGEKYVRAVRGKRWNVYPLSRSAIERLAGRRFTATYKTPEVAKYPQRFAIAPSPAVRSILQVVPAIMFKVCSPLLPSHIFVLKKSNAEAAAE